MVVQVGVVDRQQITLLVVVEELEQLVAMTLLVAVMVLLEVVE
jgi:hypothetical protein